MTNIKGLSLLISSILIWGSWASAEVKYEKTVAAPWKTAEVELRTRASASKMTISHVKQRTKIHSVVINNELEVYNFDEDPTLKDHRGQIKSDLPPVVISLGGSKYIESVQIVAEGWNRPTDQNLFKVTLEEGGSSSSGLNFTGRWNSSRVERQGFARTTIESIEIQVSDTTEIHRLRLQSVSGFYYDILSSSNLINNPYVERTRVINLAEKIDAIGVEIEAESRSRSRTNTAVTLVLNGDGSGPQLPPEEKKCRYNGVDYYEGEAWEQVIDTTERPDDCPFGGFKVDVYEIVQPRICRDGSPRDNGRTFERYLTSRGQCAPRISRCRENGREYVDGETWEKVVNQVEKSASCPRGGNKVDVYDVIQPRICRDGASRNNGRTYERFALTKGECKKRELHCVTRNGKRRENREEWVTRPRRRTISEPVSCEFGGNKENIYQAVVRKRCRRGDIIELGESRGRLIETKGQCRQRPKKSCGNTPHNGTVWKRAKGETIEVAESCPFGGNKRTVYAKQKLYICKNGDLKEKRDSATRERRGRKLREVGQCKAAKGCGRRAHNDTWSESTGRTRTEQRACGRGGKQDVVYEIHQGKQCKNGDVSNTGRIKKEKSVGVCKEPPVMCKSIKILRSGQIERNNFCDRESAPCTVIPRSKVGKSHSGTCDRGRDEDRGNYTVTCQANGTWKMTGSCVRRGGGDR